MPERVSSARFKGIKEYRGARGVRLHAGRETENVLLFLLLCGNGTASSGPLPRAGEGGTGPRADAGGGGKVVGSCAVVAGELLVGSHDFKAFCASGSSAKTSVREIYSAEVGRERAGEGWVYRVRVCGNGFLYNMVRIIAGELYAVGCGKEEGITAAFETRRRNCLARTMPPNGLLMERVEYETELF